MIKMNNRKIELAMDIVRCNAQGAIRKYAEETIAKALAPEEKKKELLPTQEQMDRLYKHVDKLTKEQHMQKAQLEMKIAEKVSKGSYYGEYGENLDMSSTRIYHNGSTLYDYIENRVKRQNVINKETKSTLNYCRIMIAALGTGFLVLGLDRILNM
jgi:hypothetical protein